MERSDFFRDRKGSGEISDRIRVRVRVREQIRDATNITISFSIQNDQ